VIQVNLLPKEEQVADPRFAMTLPRPGFWIPLVVGLGVLLPLGGLIAMQRARIQSVREDIQQAEVESQRLKPQIERIHQLETEREELNMRLAVIQGLCRERYLPVETMDHLADRVPENLWLTRVAETGPGQLTVEGLAFSNLMVAELMTNMEQSDLFDGVALVVAERSKKESSPELPVLAFTLTARMKP
jgi:type IV pilus assembly protein PilN